MIAELCELKFSLGIEANYAGYFGVNIIKLPDGQLNPTQVWQIRHCQGIDSRSLVNSSSSSMQLCPRT
jgi:hypothetical protein